METINAPFQYSVLGTLIKKFLHTKVGARVGYMLGVAGFNRVEAIVHKYVRDATSPMFLKRGEFTKMRELEDGTKVQAVYRMGKVSYSYNARVDAGAAFASSLLSGTTLGGISAPAAAKYIACSTSSLTPAKGDTTLSGETAASSMGRALATAGTYVAPSVLDGAASYVLTKTFTSSGAITIVSTGIFDAASTGNMLAEANLTSSAVLANGDTLTINWTHNI